MYKIISILGARPQFIKAAALCRAIKESYSFQLEHYILHTGQHYDDNMSAIFFEELQLDSPLYHLDIRSDNNVFPMQEAADRIKDILLTEKPSMIVVYGDTYSTLAGAIAAEKTGIPLAHIEAGMRSYDETMPEEINRVETDKLATYLFCSTQTAVKNLQKEGYSLHTHPPYHSKNKKIMFSGDIMYDNALYFSNKNIQLNSQLQNLLQEIPSYVLTTLHRQHNTDNAYRLKEFIQGLLLIAENKQHILFAVHPRTKKMMQTFLDEKNYNTFLSDEYIHCVEPLSFFEMMYMEKNARMIITDSGGVQKEAYFYKKPCIIIRDETEWEELLTYHVARLSDAKAEAILQNYLYFIQHSPVHFPSIFGNGTAAHYICKEIIEILESENIS